MSFNVSVDPANPGQFFACCGLLELADRLWPGAEGWFADGRFYVRCKEELLTLLTALTSASFDLIERLENGLGARPIIAPLRLTFNGEALVLTLDAWMTIGVARVGPEKGTVAAIANQPWNFWSGQQTPFRIWGPVRASLATLLAGINDHELVNLFNQRQFLTGRFGFDPGPAWNALDVGFSPNEQGIAVESSPAVELLAAIGLQRFRPRMDENRDSFTYATWGTALPPFVACAAACGAVRFDPSVLHRGRVVARGQYAALGYSTILTGAANE